MVNNITINDITTKAIDGTGSFDILMASMKLHIQQEFSEGRIKGADYANVYLSSMQTALTQSISYELQKAQVMADIALKELQKEMEEYKRDNIVPKELEGIEEDVRLKYTIRVGKDKEVANLGLDSVVKTQNTTPPDVYTPKYVE